jgi:hypothetical protein
MRIFPQAKRRFLLSTPGLCAAMKRSIAGLAGLALISLGIRFPSTSSPTPGQADKFIVYVVGKGLSGSSYRDPNCDKAGQQLSACAMARGVHAAYESNQFKKFTSLIEYREADDHGNLQEAKSLARHLGTDAHVLAVIGHSYSETTGQAALVYAADKIPLLIPIATSPEIGYTSSWGFWTAQSGARQHLQNVFRLIPNDRIGQAPSVAHVVAKLRAPESMNDAILVDLSDNKQYTKGLQKELRQKLPDAQMGEIREDCKDDSLLPPSCFNWNGPTVSPELLVFVGTGKSSTRFLRLAILHRNDALNRLKYILMTDGAKNVDPLTLEQLIPTGIPLLLTFPTKQLSAAAELSSAFKPLKDALPQNGIQSYEEYGFDSLILISKALEPLMDSKQQISRGTLMYELNQIDAMQGATNLFIFHDGENVHPDYGIYGVGTDEQLDKLKNTMCETRHFAPPLDQPTQGLRYLCYVGFDEVNLR